MRLRAAPLAACVIVAAVSGCRRQPPARMPDGGADMIAGRADADATIDARPDATLDAARDSEEPADTGAGETIATDAAVETKAEDARVDLASDLHPEAASTDAPSDTPAADAPADQAPDGSNGDTPPDVPIGDAAADRGDAPPDAAADAPSTDGTTPDVRPEDQPCGTLGISCRPFACDVARGVCKAACLTDDDCFTGIHCNAGNLCGYKEDTVCGADDECQSGHCAQGVCCATACNQRCYSCASLGSLKTCAPVPAGAQDPTGTCPTGTFCDGRGECVPPTCTADGDCGLFHLCTNGHCVPCTPTCVTTTECATPAICSGRNGCTYCGIADAGAAQ